MPDKPPFDTIKACFYLIAGILAFQCLVVLLGLGFCFYWSGQIVEGNFNCSHVGDSMTQLLTGALAAALAFTGGFTRKPPP